MRLFNVMIFTLGIWMGSFPVNAVEPAASEKKPAAKAPETDEDGYKSLFLFMNVMQMLRENYVEQDKVSYDRLMKGAMKGMLNELDPFSAYETPEHYNQTIEDTKGEFSGLGIVVTSKNNILEVVAPMEDTPGFKAGIQPGDIIMEINGKSTRNMNLNECVETMKGPAGTSVEITIYRKS